MSNRFIPERELAAPSDKHPVFEGKPPVIYSATQVGIATFLGGPIAGGIVLAVSHRHARTGKEWPAVILGVVVMILLGLAEYLRPHVLGESLDRWIPVVLSILVMRLIAQAQLRTISESLHGRLEEGSWALPLGVGFGFAGGMVALVLIAM